MMSPDDILKEEVSADSPLWPVLLNHSRAVAFKAICLARKTPFWHELDLEFIWEAGMLHDIGVVRTHAPKIYCTGEKPYITHGVEGAKILLEHHLSRHARVALTHVGAGLVAEDIQKNNWPMPPEDMIPQSKEEILVSVADKFFSKSQNLRQEESMTEIRKELDGYGPAARERFEGYLQTLGLAL